MGQEVSSKIMNDLTLVMSQKSSNLIGNFGQKLTKSFLFCTRLLLPLLLLLSHFSRVQLCAIPWTTAHQAPQSMGFSRQEHWSGVPLPSPELGREESKNQNLMITLRILTEEFLKN